jgi:hypothetical protein
VGLVPNDLDGQPPLEALTESMDRKDLKTKILQSFLRFRASWGYPAACALIALIAVAAWEFWSQSLRSTIVIEAGAKGGFPRAIRSRKHPCRIGVE